MVNKNQTKNLATILGIGGLNGAIPIAALAGLFRPENAVMLALVFLAGPGAIVTAMLMPGATGERMFAAFLAGIIATIIVVFSAGFGPTLLNHLNINVIKIFGGISIGVIAFMVAGVKVPGNTPLAIMIIGIIGGILFK